MTVDPVNLRTLVLNADFQPLSVWPLSLVPCQDAIRTVYKDRAYVVDEWDAVLRSPSTSIKVPRVIALKNYVPVDAEPKFCRRSILLRDHLRCQYCGNRFDAQDLTFDHVIPRSKGGKTTWDNILSACIECNKRKKNSMPNYSGRKGSDDMRPLKPPRRPTSMELLRAGLDFLDPKVKEDYGDFLYWDAELEP